MQLAQVVQFPRRKLPNVTGDEFPTTEGTASLIINDQCLRLQKPCTVIHFGVDTFFSLWVGSKVTQNFLAALTAQQFSGMADVEDVFTELHWELSRGG